MVVCLATHVCHVVESKVRLVVSVIYVNTIGVRIRFRNKVDSNSFGTRCRDTNEHKQNNLSYYFWIIEVLVSNYSNT